MFTLTTSTSRCASLLLKNRSDMLMCALVTLFLHLCPCMINAYPSAPTPSQETMGYPHLLAQQNADEYGYQTPIPQNAYAYHAQPRFQPRMAGFSRLPEPQHELNENMLSVPMPQDPNEYFFPHPGPVNPIHPLPSEFLRSYDAPFGPTPAFRPDAAFEPNPAFQSDPVFTSESGMNTLFPQYHVSREQITLHDIGESRSVEKSMGPDPQELAQNANTTDLETLLSHPHIFAAEQEGGPVSDTMKMFLKTNYVPANETVVRDEEGKIEYTKRVLEPLAKPLPRPFVVRRPPPPMPLTGAPMRQPSYNTMAPPMMGQYPVPNPSFQLPDTQIPMPVGPPPSANFPPRPVYQNRPPYY